MRRPGGLNERRLGPKVQDQGAGSFRVWRGPLPGCTPACHPPPRPTSKTRHARDEAQRRGFGGTPTFGSEPSREFKSSRALLMKIAEGRTGQLDGGGFRGRRNPNGESLLSGPRRAQGPLGPRLGAAGSLGSLSLPAETQSSSTSAHCHRPLAACRARGRSAGGPGGPTCPVAASRGALTHRATVASTPPDAPSRGPQQLHSPVTGVPAVSPSSRGSGGPGPRAAPRAGPSAGPAPSPQEARGSPVNEGLWEGKWAVQTALRGRLPIMGEQAARPPRPPHGYMTDLKALIPTDPRQKLFSSRRQRLGIVNLLPRC